MYQIFKKFARLSAMGLILSFFLFCTDTVSAAASNSIPQAVTDTADGIVQLLVCCTDESGNIYYIHQGTGFLVGSSSDTQYLITDSQTVTPAASELNQIRKWNGLGADTKLTAQIQLLLEPDILMSASIVSKGTDLPYALLTPGTPLSNGEGLKMGRVADIEKNQTAYLYGYDLELSILGQKNSSPAPLTSHTGTITSVETTPPGISCNIDAKGGCAGAPLLDKNGCVLGMFYESGGNLEVLPADTITKLLEALNINYKENDPNSNYNVADDKIKKELSDLLAECQEDVTKNGSSYSQKTLTNYKTAITSAMQVISSVDSTRDSYQDSITALSSAREKLKPQNFTFRIVQLVLLAVLLVTAFFHLRQLKKFRGLLAILHPEAEIEPEPSLERPPAALIRTDTKEVIWLEHKELRIGSDERNVDYCITDNPAVSHYHAAIVYKNHQYYIIDNHSTNRTCVNHSPIEPDYPVPLQDEDSLLLANIPFQFRITPV